MHWLITYPSRFPEVGSRASAAERPPLNMPMRKTGSTSPLAIPPTSLPFIKPGSSLCPTSTYFCSKMVESIRSALAKKKKRVC